MTPTILAKGTGCDDSTHPSYPMGTEGSLVSLRHPSSTTNIKVHRHVLDGGRYAEKVVAMCRSRQWTNMDAQPPTALEVRNEGPSGLSVRRLHPARLLVPIPLCVVQT